MSFLYSKIQSWITHCIPPWCSSICHNPSFLPCLPWSWYFWRVLGCCFIRMSLIVGLSDAFWDSTEVPQFWQEYHKFISVLHVSFTRWLSLMTSDTDFDQLVKVFSAEFLQLKVSVFLFVAKKYPGRHR